MKERRRKKSIDIVMAKIKQEEEDDDDEEEAMNRKIAKSLMPKRQGVDATGEHQQLAHVKEVEIQKCVQESELTLSAEGHKSELAYDRNRKLFKKELQTKMIDVEKKDAAIDHIIEKLVEKEKELDTRLEKCKKKENTRRKDKGLKEKANFLREEEKSLENEKQIIVSDRENFLNLKTEVNQMKAEVEAQQLKISDGTEMLNRTEEERLKLLQLEELSILCREGCKLQCMLKKEIQEYKTQKELLVKENEELRQVRKNLEEKESEIDKDLTIITEHKQRFEELKHSEEEHFRQKRQAALEHIEKDLNALERSKRSFASSLDSEKAVIREKIQNARCEMLREFSELKEQFVNELQSKLKYESEQYRLKKELLRKETEQLKQERVNLDEKLSEIKRGLIDVNDQKQRFEELKQSEEENLKQEKLATQEYIQRELDALERSKKSLASMMDHEKTVLSERIQNARCQILLEFSELKEQLENELLSKLKHESEQCRLQKEVLAKESEQLKQERVNLDEKLSELEKGLIDLNERKQKLAKLKHSEEENLKQQKLATQEYLQRELDALKVSKENIEKHRVQICQEYELQKRQCENEVQSKLKRETDVCRLQKELLLKENEDLRQKKKAFDLYLGELDKKQSQIQEQLIDLRDQRDKFEQQKTSEVERLKQEKLAAEEYKRREFDVVKLTKEKIQNERRKMLHELKLWKTQLENEMECKREEMEKQFSVREKLVERREKEVNTINYLRELVRGEMQEIKLERLKIEGHHFQMCKGIDCLKNHKSKLMVQLKPFLKDRENTSFLHRVEMFPAALGSGSAVSGYRNVTPEMSNLPLLVANEMVLPIILGSDSAICASRNGTSNMCSLPPVMVNACSPRIVEIEDIHDPPADDDIDVHKKHDVAKKLGSSHLENKESTVLSVVVQDSKEIMGISLDENQQKCLNSDADHLICMPSKSRTESSVVDEILVASGGGESSGRSSKKRRKVTPDSPIADQKRDLTLLTLTDSNSGSMTGVDCGSNDQKYINLQRKYAKQSKNAACGGNQEVSATRKSKRQRRISQVLEDYHLEYFV